MHHMKLITERLLIRNMKISDLEDLYLVYSNDQVMKYVEPTFSLEKTREFIEKFGLIGTPLVYSIEVKNTSKVIGHFIYHFFEDNKTYEIGFILNNQYWNKGYGKGAMTTYDLEKFICENLPFRGQQPYLYHATDLHGVLSSD